MGLFASVNAWYEVLVRDFIRQNLKGLIGDRAAAYCPEDSFQIPSKDRKQFLVCASLKPAVLNTLRETCREHKVTFHALLSSCLLISYSKSRAKRHPPKPFTSDRIFRAVLLFVVAIVATLVSATGSNKVINYLSSFLGIFAGVMAVFKITELPPGFANVTTESQILLKTDKGRRRCSGRVVNNVDVDSKLWEVAKAYNKCLQDKWVLNGAGFELTKVLSSIHQEAEVGTSSYNKLKSSITEEEDKDFNERDEVKSKDKTKTSWLAKFRRVVLRLDNSDRLPGGRLFGLACRQLPQEEKEVVGEAKEKEKKISAVKTDEPLLDQMSDVGLSFEYDQYNKRAKVSTSNDVAKHTKSAHSDHHPVWILDPSSTNKTPHAVLDESVKGPGFCLYYSTGPVSQETTTTTTADVDGGAVQEGEEGSEKGNMQRNALSNDRTLSLTLGYVGWDIVNQKMHNAVNKKLDEHAAEILHEVVHVLNTEAALVEAAASFKTVQGEANSETEVKHKESKRNESKKTK